MTFIISLAQIAVSVMIIALILLQDRSSDVGGGLFGGGETGGFYQARRGVEKLVFGGTVVLVVLYGGLALAHFFL
jgi:protein translocase SecG subunit